MAPTTLVNEDIERGRAAVEALDEAGVRPRAAFWRYTPESSDWRLVIALPTVNREGPRSGYEQVQRILKRKQVELPVWRITLLSTDDPLSMWAAQRARQMGHEPGVRSSSNVVDDTLVEDTYIYRSL